MGGRHEAKGSSSQAALPRISWQALLLAPSSACCARSCSVPAAEAQPKCLQGGCRWGWRMSLRMKAGCGDGRRVLSHPGGVWQAKPAKPNLQDGRKASFKSSCISLVPLDLQINDVRNPSANSLCSSICFFPRVERTPWRKRLGKFCIEAAGSDGFSTDWLDGEC